MQLHSIDPTTRRIMAPVTLAKITFGPVIDLERNQWREIVPAAHVAADALKGGAA